MIRLRYERKYLYTAAAFALLMFPINASADKYARDGGTSSACTTWADACDQISTAENIASNGETIWVAEGTYNGFTADVADITIRKATASSHGTETGWSSGYGDGQATIGTIQVHASGITIDGVTRNESNWADGNSYGFRTDIYTSTFDTGSVCPDDITIQYINAGGAESTAYTGSEPNEAIYIGGFHNTCSNWTISRSYLHNIAHYTLIQAVKLANSTIQYTLFSNSWGKEAIRGQGQFSGNTIRWNQFRDACGSTGVAGEGCTAEIAAWGDSGPWDGNAVYGNYFYQSNTNRHDRNTGGTIIIGGNGSSWVGGSGSNNLVYNNTIAGGHSDMSAGYILLNGGSGNICRNNLWYQVNVASASCSTTSNNGNPSSNPFVSYPSNLHLSSGIGGGWTISSPYNTDMDGNTRGVDGVWDQGAFEYVAFEYVIGGGAVKIPMAPFNIIIE